MLKTKLLIFGLFIILVTLLIVLLWPKASSENKKETPTIPTPTEKIEKINLINIIPPSNPSGNYLPIVQVEMTFNTKVNPRQLYYQVNPQVKTKVDPKPGSDNTLILSPEIIWQPGLTTITILPQTTSEDGRTLGQSFIYQLNTAFPKTPDEEDASY